jgi:hypothetical protein
MLTGSLTLAQSAATVAGSGPPPGFDPAKMLADRMVTYAEQDKSNPPPKDAVVFVGSSIFDQWAAVKEQMAPMPVFNRAIGGTTTNQQLRNMDQLVLQYRPRVVVYYCGSNDVNEGVSAATIVDNFRQFVERVESELPKTRVIVASILLAPQKQALWNVVDDANARLKAYAVKSKGITYVDLNPAVFDKNGVPRLELYQEDQLHYKAPAYEEFARIIKPVLQQVWQNN